MAESHFITITYSQIHQLAENHQEVPRLIKVIVIDNQRDEFEKIELVALSAECRYNFIRKHNNSLFGKVPAKMIASYLQMSRETLGRYMSKK